MLPPRQCHMQDLPCKPQTPSVMPPLLQHDENRQLKTTQGHLMHCSHICIMDLPALQGLFHFCMGVDSPTCRQAHAGTGMDLSTWTVCWPTAIIPVSNLMLAQERQTGVLSHSRAQYKGVLCTQDRYRDTSKNIMLPLKAT